MEVAFFVRDGSGDSQRKVQALLTQHFQFIVCIGKDAEMRSCFPGVEGTLMSILLTHKLDIQTHARSNVGLEPLCTLAFSLAFSIINKRFETS